MNSPITPSNVFRLFLVVVIGVSLGLMVWELSITLGWTEYGLWISNSVGPMVPVLALAWIVSVIAYSIRLLSPSTRSATTMRLITLLGVWLGTMLLVIGVMYFDGIAYPYGTTIPTIGDFISLLGEAGYLAAALNFGFVVAPLLIVYVARKALRLA